MQRGLYFDYLINNVDQCDSSCQEGRVRRHFSSFFLFYIHSLLVGPHFSRTKHCLEQPWHAEAFTLNRDLHGQALFPHARHLFEDRCSDFGKGVLLESQRFSGMYVDLRIRWGLEKKPTELNPMKQELYIMTSNLCQGSAIIFFSPLKAHEDCHQSTIAIKNK